VGADRKIFAVLKADAYGFGALPMARAFAANGADALAVADLGEGVRLRRHGITLPILVYPNALPDAAADLLRHDLIPTVTDLESARAYSRAVAAGARAAVGTSGASNGSCPVFVKVDVGLERLGIPAEQAVKVIRAILDTPRLRLAGIYAHPHAPDGVGAEYVEWQIARFTSVIDELTNAGIEAPVRLAASSSLVLQFPAAYFNAVDPGRMLYGVPLEREPVGTSLRAAFVALKTRLIEVKELTPRDRFAAAAPFPIRTGMRLGVVPLGSGDGLLNLHAGRMLVRARAVPLLGAPSLEHTRLDLTAVPDARVGDDVVVIGRQGPQEITVAEVATHHGRQPLHVAPAIGSRIARVYLSAGRDD
jgi:alanine racemase